MPGRWFARALAVSPSLAGSALPVVGVGEAPCRLCFSPLGDCGHGPAFRDPEVHEQAPQRRPWVDDCPSVCAVSRCRVVALECLVDPLVGRCREPEEPPGGRPVRWPPSSRPSPCSRWGFSGDPPNARLRHVRQQGDRRPKPRVHRIPVVLALGGAASVPRPPGRSPPQSGHARCSTA
jgi:hypothetical protein